MGVQIEKWIKQYRDYLYKNSVVLNTGTDLSAYIEGTTIHIPNVSVALNVVETRLAYPATGATRTDTEALILLKKYAPETFNIFHWEEAMINSYDKRASTIKWQANFLKEKFDSRVLWNWSKTASDFDTTGAVNPATGKRRMLWVDFLEASRRMDIQNVPKEGRAVVMYTDMWYDLQADPAFQGSFLINYLDKSQKNNGNDLLTYQGRLDGVDIYTRSWTPRYTDANAKVALMTVTNVIDDATIVATDRYSAIFYQKDCVGFGLGEITVGIQRLVPELDNADKIQSVMWGGGERLRTGSEGVIIMRQGE